jgi:nitrile hydratase accessory protein
MTSADGTLAAVGPLPRDDDGRAFEEPWQGRALGMVVVVLERHGLTWVDFSPHLAAAVAARPVQAGEGAAAAYYAAVLDALEALLAERGLLAAAQLPVGSDAGSAGSGAR